MYTYVYICIPLYTIDYHCIPEITRIIQKYPEYILFFFSGGPWQPLESIAPLFYRVPCAWWSKVPLSFNMLPSLRTSLSKKRKFRGVWEDSCCSMSRWRCAQTLVTAGGAQRQLGLGWMGHGISWYDKRIYIRIITNIIYVYICKID